MYMHQDMQNYISIHVNTRVHSKMYFTSCPLYIQSKLSRLTTVVFHVMSVIHTVKT